eukprot:GEMP01103270.1.p1 GENE.GEMP01103270.1~~GEMP01103270.1.p1  ORF type:complete len:215 (+),score=33.02 GEMP01103270.1:70-714(+)
MGCVPCFQWLEERWNLVKVLWSNEALASGAYWNAAYKRGDYGKTYEWLQTYAVLKRFLLPHGRVGEAVLHLGCGNSTLGVELYNDVKGKWGTIFNVDISPAVVHSMKCYEDAGLVWDVQDGRRMRYKDGYFGFCFDKGGLDALLEGKDEDGARDMVSEVRRVLRPGSVFVLISLEGSRKTFLRQFFSEVTMEEVDGFSCDLVPHRPCFIYTSTI